MAAVDDVLAIVKRLGGSCSTGDLEREFRRDVSADISVFVNAVNKALQTDALDYREGMMRLTDYQGRSSSSP